MNDKNTKLLHNFEILFIYLYEALVKKLMF